jgi:hypothetical protein
VDRYSVRIDQEYDLESSAVLVGDRIRHAENPIGVLHQRSMIPTALPGQEIALQNRKREIALEAVVRIRAGCHAEPSHQGEVSIRE